MKNSLSVLLILLFLPFITYANVDNDIWSYVFHLEYKQGVLKVEEGIKFPYSSVPMAYQETYPAGSADFYGVVVSIQNKEEARFGFMTPTTMIPALGKSIMDIPAPYFADADHVSFYNKANAHLFDISVKGSSFCNDNNTCDENTGENSRNCPNDCPPLPGETLPTVPTTPPQQIPVAPTNPVVVTQPTSTSSNTLPANGGTVTREEAPPTKNNVVIPLTIGITMILLSFVGLFAFKRRGSSELNP